LMNSAKFVFISTNSNSQRRGAESAEVAEEKQPDKRNDVAAED
jgi:hypothetical protein